MTVADRVLRGVGLAEPVDRRLAWRVVAAALAVYALGFALFYPRVATNDDEAKYLRQAQLMAQGSTTTWKLDARSGEKVLLEPSQYPPGTAGLMAPFVFAAGWRGAYLMPLLALCAGVWLTGRWIADQGRSPAFALTMLSFPATLVLGRVTMSDVPSLAAVALGLWLFWRGVRGSPWLWLASGFVAGASMLLREPNALLFAPLFAGTLLRREWKCWALVVGGVAGVAFRLAAMYATFGDPLYVKAPYIFHPETVMERLPIYLLGLVVLVPGGLLFGFAYRGERRPEIVATIALCFLFYLFQPFSMLESSFAKRLVIALRYFVPLLPILAFAMSESVPRLWHSLAGRLPTSVAAPLGAGLASLYLASVVAASGLVHPVYDRWGDTQAAIQAAIHETTGPESILVTNWWATKKFTRELDRTYLPIDRDEIEPAEVEALAARHERVFVALLDRSDSDHWRGDALRNARFVEALEPPPELAFDQVLSPTDRLKIWRVKPPTGR
jgi:4-amino-4-deoxy-L-arabinose transferase-like glycosyltransferase